MAFDKGYGQRNIPPFNGGLFRGDALLNTLKIRDFRLADLMDFLNSYNFQGQLNVNVLGHIFEQSISDIEDIKARLQREDPLAGGSLEPVAATTISKRKKEGVFYTPDYITRYMVEQAVGGWLDDREADILRDLGIDHLPDLTDDDFRTIKLSDTSHYERNDAIALHVRFWELYQPHLETIRVLDPACGSGAFLTQVFDFLWEKWRVLKEETYKLVTPYDQQLKELAARSGQSIGLTARPYREWEIKKTIVSRNIYGVDLNPESVEITKLALWLKTASKTETLANLDNHVRQGNSLVSDPAVSEYAFDWDTEFKGVRFDVIVGNPPYVDIKQMPNDYVVHYFKEFETAENRINLYSLFIERGSQIINDNGKLSFVIPNSILVNSSYSKIRTRILSGLSEIVKLPDNVFEDADVETIIFLLNQGVQIDDVRVLLFGREEKITVIEAQSERFRSIDKSEWDVNEPVFNIHADSAINGIIRKTYEGSVLLDSICDFSLGITPYDKYRGHSSETIKNRLFHSKEKIDATFMPLIAGENITRFSVSTSIREYIKYGDWLGAMRQERFFTEPRIIVRQIASGSPPRIFAGYTDKPLYFTQIGFSIIPKTDSYSIKYLLCLLNSSLMSFVHRYKFTDIEKELFPKILIESCKNFPIKYAPDEKQDELMALADQMLTLSAQLQTLTTQVADMLQTNLGVPKLTEKLLHWPNLDWPGLLDELKKQKIGVALPKQMDWKPFYEEQRAKATALLTTRATTDRQINQLVYALYNLTPAEIALVEGV